MAQNPIFRLATKEEVPTVMEIIQIAKETIAHPDWYLAVPEEFVRRCVAEQGFIVGAYIDEEMAGFLLIHYPEETPENLGNDLGWPDEKKARVAHMDTVCVLPAYRGLGLHRQLLAWAEEHLQAMPYCYYLTTVHPDNSYSLRNFQKSGYQIVATRPKYGGLPRHILCKEKE